MKPINGVGRRFSRLLLVERLPRTPEDTSTRYVCICDCGTQTTKTWSNLTAGNSTSCGCLRKEVTSVRARKPLRHVITTQVCNYYKRNARIRNIEWNLTKEEFEQLIFSVCWWCGIGCETITKTTWTPKTGARRVLANNGVDRIDNKLGYTKENSVTCCKHCNIAKHTMTPKEFASWARRLVSNLENKKCTTN